MFRYCLLALFVCSLAGTAVAQPEEKPQPVPRLVDRSLDKASYAELARQWKEYIEKNGETVEALVNLGMAHDYSNSAEAALTAARRAAELGPDDPLALWFLGRMLATYKADDDAALEALEHCREVAPDYERCLTMLAVTYLRRGDLTEAEDVFKSIFDRRIISRPLQDYAYNTLVGLPEGAVIISWGDHDTVPVLALQAGMDFRRDVIVLNCSLLNLPSYAEAYFDRYPKIRPEYNIEAHEVKMVDGRPTTLADALITKLIEESKAPVYLTASAAGVGQFNQRETYLEGMNMRAARKGLSPEESARLFLTTYRLDSATDWTIPWSLAPSEAHLMINYVTSIIKLVDMKGVSGETRTRLLDKASAIAEFHEMDRLTPHIRTLRKK